MRVQLEENGLRSLANIGPLPKLRSLFLAFNRLAELSEFDQLSPERACPALQEVTVRNNPLARKHLYRAMLVRKLTTLVSIDGQPITNEERFKTDEMFMGPAMPTEPSNFYFVNSADPRLEKVPIRVQSFTLSGFGLDNQDQERSLFQAQASPVSNSSQRAVAPQGPRFFNYPALPSGVPSGLPSVPPTSVGTPSGQARAAAQNGILAPPHPSAPVTAQNIVPGPLWRPNSLGPGPNLPQKGMSQQKMPVPATGTKSKTGQRDSVVAVAIAPNSQQPMHNPLPLQQPVPARVQTGRSRRRPPTTSAKTGSTNNSTPTTFFQF